jgi:hypothetical protein
LILFDPDGLRQIFQIHLVADARAGRHDAEIVERLSVPSAGIHTAPFLFEFDHRRFSGTRMGVPKSLTITEWSMTRSTGRAD